MTGSDDRFGSGPDAHWDEALRGGRFLIQRCPTCRVHRFPPAIVCANCGATSQQWVEAEGHGTVYATTTVRAREGDYNVSLITLDEGCRLMSRVDGMAPDSVRIGMRVRSRIAAADGAEPVVIFVAAEASA